MNKTAVITGAGGVLCGIFAKALAADGYSVALLDINLDAVKVLEGEIRAAGGVAFAYGCSVLDRAQLESVRERILSDMGKCSLLINGAGGNNPRATTDHETYETGDEDREDIKTLFNLDKSGVDFVFDLNIKGVLLPTQVFARDMVRAAGSAEDCAGTDNGGAGANPDEAAAGGAIINISSMNAFTPLTKIPAYSAAKAGVSNLTQWLAVHLAPAGVRVNAIAPGFFVTNQNRALLYTPDGAPTARTGKILAATPAGRFGKPEELTGVLRFLAGPEASSFVTGVIIPVDGGFSAYSGV